MGVGPAYVLEDHTGVQSLLHISRPIQIAVGPAFDANRRCYKFGCVLSTVADATGKT